jgi:hypothetical protein
MDAPPPPPAYVAEATAAATSIDPHDVPPADSEPAIDPRELAPREAPPPPAPQASTGKPPRRLHIIGDYEPMVFIARRPDGATVGTALRLHAGVDLTGWATVHVEAVAPLSMDTIASDDEQPCYDSCQPEHETVFRIMTGASVHTPAPWGLVFGLAGSVGLVGEVAQNVPFSSTGSSWQAIAIGPATDLSPYIDIHIFRALWLDLGLHVGAAYLPARGDPHEAWNIAGYLAADIGPRLDFDL